MSRPRRHPSENSRRRFTDATWLDDLPDIDTVDEDAPRPDAAREPEQASSTAPETRPEAEPASDPPPSPAPNGDGPGDEAAPRQPSTRAADPAPSSSPERAPTGPGPEAGAPQPPASVDDPFAGAFAASEDRSPEPSAPEPDPFARKISADRAEPAPPTAGEGAPADSAEPTPAAEEAPADSAGPTPADPFSSRISAAPPPADPADPFADHIRADAPPRAAEPPRSSEPASAEVPQAVGARAPTVDPPATAEPGSPPDNEQALQPRPAPALRTATRLGVPAVIWERSAPSPVPQIDENGAGPQSAVGNGSITLPPPGRTSPQPDPEGVPDPHAEDECEICGTAGTGEALTRCPICRRDTCDDCHDGGICRPCSDLHVPTPAERELLAPLQPPADGVRISADADVRVVTIQSGPRRELAVMRDGAVERWWRSDRAEPNHYRVNRALEDHLGLRDAAGLRVLPLTGADDGDEVLQVGGGGRLVAEITSIDADGGLSAPQSLELSATPPGPSGLLRVIAEQLDCDQAPVPWVVPSGLRRYFDRLVPPADEASPATISLAPTVRRSGVKVSARGLVEPNGGVAPFAPIEPGSAPLLGGRLDEWFPRPRVVAAARGVAASAVLLEVGGSAVLAVQDGDTVTYHSSAVPEPGTEEIIGGALNPDGRPAQVSSVVDPAQIAASRVTDAELLSRRARPVARPSADWASAAAGVATVARFRLDQAVRTPHVELDLPTPVAVALHSELMRHGVERPAMLEVGAEVHERWRGRACESEHVYVVYPEDLAPEAPGYPELILDDEGHFATHARRCAYCETTRCDDCEHLVRSCIICKVDLCASCRGPATIGLPVCPACSSLALEPPPRRFGLRGRSPEVLTGSDSVHEVTVERHDDGWYLRAPDGESRLPIARDYRVAGFLERLLDG